MTKISDKNSQLIAETIKKHQEDYYRVAYSYVKDKDDALDIVQEAVYKALTSVHKLRQPEYVNTWLYRIVINTSISHLRKQKPIDLNRPIPEQIVHKDDLMAASIDLHAAIDQLNEDQKTVIILRYFEDLKIDEIAEVISINANTVKSRLYSAVNKLKIMVEGEL